MWLMLFTIFFYFLIGTRRGMATDCGSWKSVKHLSLRIEERILDNADPIKENGGAAALHNSATNLGPSSQKCGATLITDRHLLTAAHCMTGTERMIGISLGRNDLRIDPTPGPDTYGIQGVFIHPLYKSESHSSYHDIAILQTDRKVTFSPNIWPYCLPEPHTTYTDYTLMTIVGWGTVGNSFNTSPTMKVAFVRIVDNQRCEQQWRQDPDGAAYYDTVIHRYSYPNGLTEQVLCAGRSGVDACDGDSGGPMSHQNKAGAHVVVGLISLGVPCAEYPAYPGFYTNVANYIGWIKEITGLSNSASHIGAPHPRPPSTQRPVEKFTTSATTWTSTAAVSSTASPNRAPQPRRPSTQRPVERFTTPGTAGSLPQPDFGSPNFSRPGSPSGVGVNPGFLNTGHGRSKPGHCTLVEINCPETKNFTMPPSTCSFDTDCIGSNICCSNPCVQYDTCFVPHIDDRGIISGCLTYPPPIPKDPCEELIIESCGYHVCTETLQQFAPTLFGGGRLQFAGSWINPFYTKMKEFEEKRQAQQAECERLKPKRDQTTWECICNDTLNCDNEICQSCGVY